MIEGLERLLSQGKDSATLRFGLGNGYLGQGQPLKAIVHLQACISQDPNYSAAFKLLAKAYADNLQPDRAIDTYRQGIDVAGRAGDKQAEKEMRVFLKRLLKQQQA